jgi:peptidoglycan/xylan/chitin deacetylase (PgdA/CDA1 family)
MTVTSVTGFAALAYSVLLGPPPAALILVGLGVHATVCFTGTFVPSLGMWADALSRRAPGTKRVALTFDDGPDPRTTRRVLQCLAEHGQRATFFVLGEKAERHADVIREATRAGHEIALHGHTHDRLYALRSVRRLREDIARGSRALEGITGVKPKLFRAPVGFVGHTVALAVESEGLTLVGHSRRALDGLARSEPNEVLERATGGLVDGAVLLLHDAAEHDNREPASLSVLPELLRAARDRGLEAVTVSELFDL